MQTAHDSGIPFQAPVTLHCPSRGIFYNTRCARLSTSGMYIGGVNCMCAGNELQVAMDAHGRRLQLAATVADADPVGVSLNFVRLNPNQRDHLRALVSPCWDGDNLLQGLIMVSHYVSCENLSQWLMMTSLLEQHLRGICRMNGRDGAEHPPSV